MARVRGQLASFRIYPEPGVSPFYFGVRVFVDQHAIRAYLRQHPVRRTFARGGEAVCTTWDWPTRSGALAPNLGEILFPCRSLNSKTVSHECAHAAIGWARRLKLRPVDDPQVDENTTVTADEERYCTALGLLVKQITEQLHVRHLVV